LSRVSLCSRLGEALEPLHPAPGHEYPDPGVAADDLLHVHYFSARAGGTQPVFERWPKNKQDLRRGAKQLPR
jgi:hypothetical protein